VACRPKHVEQLENTGIINSTTRLHFVGPFCDISHSTRTLACSLLNSYIAIGNFYEKYALINSSVALPPFTNLKFHIETSLWLWFDLMF
jgi:hypothetical protein